MEMVGQPVTTEEQPHLSQASVQTEVRAKQTHPQPRKHGNSSLSSSLAASQREITIEELSQHNGTNGRSMWTAVRNKVYDLTNFYPNHPGGDVMRLAGGREATCLFESYHPSAVKTDAILGTPQVPQIGILAAKDALPQANFDDRFFQTVRSRVQSYLKSTQTPFHFYGVVAYTELFGTLFLFFFIQCLNYYFNSVILAAFMGVLTGRMGFLMHSGNHRSTSQYQWINYVTGACMDVAGSSSCVWEHEHQIAHHMNPNEVDKDNDASIGYVLIRFHPDLQWKWWHRFNHYITVFGMSFGFFKWVISDFGVMLSAQIGSVSMHVRRRDLIKLFSFKIFWFIRNIVIPWYLFGFGRMMVLLTFMMVIGAHYLENIFIVNHIQSECSSPPLDSHWAVKQIWATANWCSASVFWNWFSGGLNHQIEHHLFPSMSTYIYPYIAPIVKQTCQEFGIPYINYATFGSAWYAMFSYLRNMGFAEYTKLTTADLTLAAKRKKIL